MVQNEDSPSQQQPTVGNSSHSLPSNPIAHFKSQERIRWKKAILSCLFIAAMFSILIHITIGLVLNYSLASGYDSGSSIDTIEVKFAVEQSEELTQMPEGQELKQQESIPTKAVAQAMQNTQASFSAETATSALDVTSHMST
ncbi:MAG: hypothetical protein QF535_06755, partial [Anaerolineales bacterium]|nr:hypothetical protein [Anaerolineales bacterium]